LTKVPTA